MADADDTLLDATTALIPPLLTGLEALAYVGRHLHPPHLAGLVDAIEGFDTRVEEGKRIFDAAPWPDQLGFFRDQLSQAAGSVLDAMSGLRASVDDPNGMMKAYRSMRHSTRAVEALYPLSYSLPAVNRFFIDLAQREDPDLAARLERAEPSREDVGILNANNTHNERGGFTLYVPEYYRQGEAMPLIVALHGGSGHGADFLWTWLREARTRGCIVVSPTSRGDTWALMGPDVDSENLARMVDYVCQRWTVDEDRILLTGMSDGGTFTLVSGLKPDSPFTHLAPSSGTFHPLLLDGAPDLRGRQIYLIHGALDWMFPVEVARNARDTLRVAGADVVYREIEDLSHTYPRDENPRVLDWLIDGVAPEPASP